MHGGEILTWVFEIVVLWVVFYQAYRFFYRERAAMIFGGLVISILLVFLFVKVIRARELEWIGTALVPISTILAVLFQNELRTALTRIGRGTFRRLMNRNVEESTVFNAICDAVTYLVNRHYGALIVLCRENKLSENVLLNRGVRLSATISAELLESIFYKGSALHDGAVIIDNERIISAAVILPVTKREIVDRSLGLRHRAAIGITEKSDAVVIIVSEETGAISLAVGGEQSSPTPLQRNLSVDALNHRLKELFRDHDRAEVHSVPPENAMAESEEAADT